jgi:hypothetical protein
MLCKRLVPIFILVLLALILVNCDKKTTDPSPTPNFELLGTWTGTDVNPPYGDVPIDFSYTFTNTGFTLNYDGDILEGSIKTYNNDTNTMVFLWTSHPAYEGMYQKFTWAEDRFSSVIVQPYAEQETQAAASSTTDLGGYQPMPMTKTVTK